MDHANRVYERTELAKRLGRAGVAITVCPNAEVQLGAAPSLADHPIRRMLQDGMRPSVHSDDPAWFGSITENYAALVHEGGLTRSEVVQLARNSFTTSFLSASTVISYLAEIDDMTKDGQGT